MKTILYVLVGLMLQIHAAFANVVVTSKPLYLVIAPLLKGIDTPTLIVSKGQCSHHHHLKPSEINAIHKAKAVFWAGAFHEPLMAHVLSAESKAVPVLSAKEGFEWLSPMRVMQALPGIVQRLKEAYDSPSPHVLIDHNAAKLTASLGVLHEKTATRTKLLKGKVFITTYPFLTCLAKDYGVNVIASMVNTPSEAMTVQRLRNVYRLLKAETVTAVIKDHHLPVAVVEKILRNYTVPIVTVDVEAIDVPLSDDGYNILIERLVQTIVHLAQ